MASSASATEAQIKSEIERLTATINRHKATQNSKPAYNSSGRKPTSTHYSPYPSVAPGRSNSYVNPGYKPANKYVRPGLNTASSSKPASKSNTPSATPTPAATPGPSAVDSSAAAPPFSKPISSVGGQKKEVVLGGVAFESSGRSLVRKDLPKPSRPVSIAKVRAAGKILPPYTRKSGHAPPGRAYKVKARRGRNMTLNNSTRPYSSTRRSANKRVNKYVDKPCPRFTTTGTCSRGLTCMYQHDPAKIAICWPFLQDNCPNTAETCNLSHEPTPERTPLCVHFLNKGRCTREKCLYPHVNVGKREGVCRDFAVLGYCERGLDCDRQHVRECPDFAEKGTCGTKGCKLPHVIRANQKRRAAADAASATAAATGAIFGVASHAGDGKVESLGEVANDAAMLTAEDGQLGDEFISLTFKESDSEEESESESGDGDEDENGETGDGSGDSDSEMGDLEVNM